MIIVGYFEDDASDELTNVLVLKVVLEKDALASQPTVSRFFNHMDIVNKYSWNDVYCLQQTPLV